MSSRICRPFFLDAAATYCVQTNDLPTAVPASRALPILSSKGKVNAETNHRNACSPTAESSNFQFGVVWGIQPLTIHELSKFQ